MLRNGGIKMKRLYKWGGYIVLLSGVVLIVIGRIRGEHLIVLKKAINICLECIGIGEGGLYNG